MKLAYVAAEKARAEFKVVSVSCRRRACAHAYNQDLLAAHGITCSMSRRGNCLDNAAMESWFSTLKFELGEDFESIHLAKEQLFDYIEVFYNQQRRHSSIDYVSPARYERERRGGVQLAA